jgi:hypothetical protein
MSTQFDIRPTVEKYSAIPIARLRVLQSFDEIHLPDMRRGIIFVLAVWSGPAVMGLQRFTKAIQLLDTHSLNLVVLDTDCLTEDSAAQLFGAPGFTTGGGGETIWIRDGRVFARVLAYSAPESLIEQHTRGLLDDNAVS